MELTRTLPPHLAEILAQDASTRQKFAALRAANRGRAAHVEEAADRFVEQVGQTFEPDALPNVGDTFPDFWLPNQYGQMIGRDAFVEESPVIISFNRGHWCFYCMLELSLWSQALSQAGALPCRMVSIIPERGMYASVLKDRCQITFPVLSDVDNGFGMSLGLTVALTDELRGHYYNRNDDIGLFQGNSGWFLPVPATFVVNRDSVILARFAAPEYRTRMDPADAMRWAKSAIDD
ncbi:MAG: redoxin domain-containing protein [Hyphomicrobiaceae bacterium]